MTLEAWVKPFQVYNGWVPLIVKEDPAYAYAYALYACTAWGGPAYTIAAFENYYDAKAPSPLLSNSWTHLAATLGNGELKIYVDGDQKGSAFTYDAIFPSNLPLRIGGEQFTDTRYKGIIDEVRIYNRALTRAEILEDMDEPIRYVEQEASAENWTEYL